MALVYSMSSHFSGISRSPQLLSTYTCMNSVLFNLNVGDPQPSILAYVFFCLMTSFTLSFVFSIQFETWAPT